MSIESYAITAQELWSLIGTERAPQIVDTRKRAVYDAAPGLLPTAIWRDIAEISQWPATLDRARPVVFACRHAHAMSQTATAYLRAEGFDARVLAGGYAAWLKPSSRW